MADDLNSIINDHDYRLRMMESKSISQDVVDRLIPAGGADGDVLTKTSGTDYATAWETPRSGYILSQTLVYSSASTFTKASYSGIKAVRVRVQAAGGGGGGAAAASASNTAIAGAGGGGAYAEKFILEASLGASESISVGAAGTGGSAGNNNGATGGTSSFGSHVSCAGGAGGTGAPTASTITGTACGAGGSVTGTVDINIEGGTGNRGVSIPTATPNYYAYAITSTGGHSFMGYAAGNALTASGVAGTSGGGYGAGGRGGTNTAGEATGKAGGTGTSGIVIVEVYI